MVIQGINAIQLSKFKEMRIGLEFEQFINTLTLRDIEKNIQYFGELKERKKNKLIELTNGSYIKVDYEKDLSTGFIQFLAIGSYYKFSAMVKMLEEKLKANQ